ncbi:MAG: short-chain dehydrogenase [Deltaproteobacteria bacterium HGW-Deltaproteobacteria-12]|nr:MAG: short-chain dehydrogenase [Deltaproteobacteria bacterium HGW-Deltaproteobacteria-12]
MDTSYLSLAGKVAVVTGGSRGIGEAIALVFADAGADVAICSRKLEDLEKVAVKIRAMGRKALAVSMHNREVESVKNAVAAIMKEFGRIDILVNNAATNPGMGFLVDMEEKMYDQIMITNLKGYTVMSQLVGKIMREQKSGNIVNVSSVGGVSPDNGLGLYCISKAGIGMLTRAMAKEMGQFNIRVNCIAPGVTRTKFSQALWSNEELMKKEMSHMPIQRVAEPVEMGRIALFLASDASAYMTGQILVADGGGSI